MPHIALIRSTYTPFGGVERVALGLAQGLLKKGVCVTLLTLPGQLWPLNNANLKIETMGLGRTHRLIQAWSFNHAVNRYLKKNPFDAILSLDKVTRFTHLHAGGGTHKRFLEIKNRQSSPWARRWRRMSLFHAYIQHLEKQGFQNPLLKKVRCNASLVKADIQRDYQVPEQKLVVIHSAIRWQAMAAVFDRCKEVGRELMQQHGIDPAWNSLLFLGSGFSRKGLDVAIQGLGSMPADYHLVVVGKGAPGAYLRMAGRLGLADRIHFLGPHPQGWRYAAFCKAVVLPSHYDPFGGASAEGHAMGLPVLVSETTGYADRVIHGQNGIILDTPMTAEVIHSGFKGLLDLINRPVQTPDQIRAHARDLDEDVILERLLGEFLEIAP